MNVELPSDAKAMRDEVKELSAEIAALEGERRRRVFGDAGLPDGAYDLVADKYDGDLTVEAVREFATSKGFALTEPKADVDLVAQQRSEGEARLSMLGQGAIPVRDPNENDQIARAEAEGDWDTYNRLQFQKLERARRGREYQAPTPAYAAQQAADARR